MAVKAKRKFVLIHKLSPGDVTTMTALVRDLHANYPNEFEIEVDTSAPDLWKYNPLLTTFPKKTAAGIKCLKLQYGAGIREQNSETIHFLNYFHRNFERQTGIPVKLTKPYGDIYLSAEERIPVIDRRYWVVISGGKSDFTIKVWQTKKFQDVVYQLQGMGLGVVQVGSTDAGHWHPPLDGTLNLVGQTNLRDLIRLIHHADGVICGVTGAMHIAAALQRPCVVLAGGREAWWWEAYVRENAGLGGLPVASQLQVPHKFLHTIGLLDCCQFRGCWKNKVVPINDDKMLCKYPIHHPEQPVPKCMDMITPTHVMEAVMQYYTDKTLAPIPLGEGQSPPTLVENNQPAKSNTRRTSSRVSIPAAMMPQLVKSLEGRGKTSLRPAATKPGQPQGMLDSQVFDHPDVGGRFTAFVLCYGDYFDMHKQCLESIVSSVPADRMDLRVGSNMLGPRSLALVDKLVASGSITKHYRHPDNAFKYPVMREMFFDPSHPITTKWVLWFDDDSIANKTPQWLNVLAQAISMHHRKDNAHMLGAIKVWTTTREQRAVFQSRPWYAGKQWRMHNGKPAPNGDKIIFCTGGFWAITHEAIVKADIPDLGSGLTHTGGDWQIGEQLYQAGFGMKMFNNSKQFVNTSAFPRRGVTMPTPGNAPLPPSPPVPEPVAEAAPPPPALPTPQPRRFLDLGL